MIKYAKVMIMQAILRKLISLVILSAVSIPLIPIVLVGWFAVWLGEWDNKKRSMFNVNR